MNNTHNYFLYLSIILLLVLLLSGCASNEFVDSPQPSVAETTSLAQPVGQTFLAHHAGLEAITLYLDPIDATPGSITLHLRGSPSAATDIRTATLPAGQIADAGYYRFEFAPILDSHGKMYYALLEGEGVAIAGAPENLYADGTRYVNNESAQGDVTLRLVYDSAAIGWDLLRFAGRTLQNILIASFLFIVPGLALITSFWRERAPSWFERIGLAAGISVALYPLLLLWAYFADIDGSVLAWLPGLLGTSALIWQFRSEFTSFLRHGPQFSASDIVPEIVATALVGLLLGTRLLPVRMMVAPAWGDSVQHTFIVQLLLDNAGLFQSWQPYAPLHSFTYHFGFHTNVALWAWLTGSATPEAMIVAGQILNVLAILVLYPITVRLTGGNKWAGVGAMVVAGLLSEMPAFYVNWGRYTQLAGQIVLPVLLWASDVWWTDEDRPSNSFLFLVCVLLAGLALTHYRIAMIGGAAVAAWALWGGWKQRRHLDEWLKRTLAFGAGALLAVVVIVPWIFILRSGRLATAQIALAQRDDNTSALWQEMQVWRSISLYYSPLLWMSGIGAALLALWKRRQLIVPVLLWGTLTFLITNPFLLNMPGTGLITNFALVIGVYMPLGIVLGWTIGVFWQKLTYRRVGYALIIGTLLILTAVGTRQQLQVLNPDNQMVTRADMHAFEWIEENTPADAKFLVNGFLAYNDTAAVGADAGWWLPYYTLRANTVPPLLYNVERMPSPQDRQDILELIKRIRASEGESSELSRLLCAEEVTHVYIGQKRGAVGLAATPLINEQWLSRSADFSLIYEQDHAQVWSFDRSSCS